MKTKVTKERAPHPDPILKKSFYVEFAGPVFSDEDRELLASTLVRVSGHVLEFILIDKDKKIEPLNIVFSKIIKNPNIGNININILSKSGEIIGTKTYEGATVAVSDFAEDLHYDGIMDERIIMSLQITAYKRKLYNGEEVI